MKITSSEIAKLANVSRATVYRVINKKPNVRPETIERVNAIIDEVGYTPNAAGQALVKQNRKDIIGVVLPVVRDEFYRSIQEGINAFVKEHEDLGIKVVCEYMDSFSVEDVLAAISRIKKKGVDALSVVAIDDKEILRAIDSFGENVPVVPIISDIDCKNKLCFVGNDQRRFGAVAGEIFSKIMGDTGKIVVVVTSLSFAVHRERLDGIKEYFRLKESGIKIFDEVVENYDSDEATYKKLKEILAQDKEITGIFFATGQGVLGYKRLIGEMDYPNRIRVVASEILPGTKEMLKNGSVDFSICQQPYEVGYSSLKVIYDYLTKRIVPEGGKIYKNFEIKGFENI